MASQVVCSLTGWAASIKALYLSDLSFLFPSLKNQHLPLGV
jgi:hypothetical protein